MPWVAITILLVLSILLIGLFYLAKEFWEFENGFFAFAGLVFLLIIGTAVYLSYAVPTFAKPPLPGTASEISVTQDWIELIPE